jgi:DNA-binding response OmpR family regulator
MRRILVIDDEKPTLSMFSLYLEAYGYQPLTADTGERGLEIFRE